MVNYQRKVAIKSLPAANGGVKKIKNPDTTLLSGFLIHHTALYTILRSLVSKGMNRE